MSRAGTFQGHMVTVGTAVCLVLLTGACGGSGSTPAVVRDAAVTAAPPSPPATDLPTDLTLASSSPPAVQTQSAQPTATASADPLSTSIVPGNFPFPDGSTHTLTNSKPTDASISLKGVTPAAAADFYRKALPGVGYKLFQQSASDGRTKVTFTGHNQSVEILAGGTTSPNLIVLVFTQCSTAVQGGAIPTRRSDRVACQ
ncbi:hypothetical protein [Frankia sp. CiP3]|uniref:hypothetical protein n=1 Tax=Frankia sp. CiP3 TaxID=2880971 RepID=UPI001EF511A6|nr:hypothetical protein [Frankia sp. CiP3]